MAKDAEKKLRKMTLQDYYENLPDATYPKTEFLNKVCMRCGVSSMTVRNWIRFGVNPSKPEYVKILSEITGIKEEDLWS